jgi:hypothetical protein
MRFVSVAATTALFLNVLLVLPAYAQQGPKVTVSTGYQDMVYTIAQNEEPLPPGFVWVCPDPNRGCDFVSASYSVHGLYADVGVEVRPNMAVVGEWNWNRSSSAGLLGGDPELTVPGLKVSVQQLSAGLRLSLTRGRFVPFAQVLVGVARVAASIPGTSESVSAPDLHAGAGIDLMFTERVGLRGSGGYTHLFTPDVRRNNVAQFGAGIVFKR